MKKILLFVAGLMLAMSASAGVYLRGNGDWNSLDKEFTDNGDGTYTLTAEFELSQSFKIADEGYSTINYGTGGEAAKIGTIPVEAGKYDNIAVTSVINVTKMILNTIESTLTIEGTEGGEIVFDGTYYIAGESESSDFVCGLKWDPKGCPLTNGTVTYTALPAGEYKFKITNGTWDQSWGLAQLPDPTAYPANNDNNVIFTLEAASDVTISFDGTTLSLTINGNGEGGDQGGEEGGEEGGDDPIDTPTGAVYYLIGYINGADYGCEADAENMGDYKFVDGTLTATFEVDSYVFVKTEGNTDWFMSDGFDQESPATLINTKNTLTDYNKLMVPGGVEVTFTLVENADGTLTLSYTTGTATDLEDVDAEDAVVAAYDLLGRPVAADAAGYVILQYASGKAVKVFNN